MLLFDMNFPHIPVLLNEVIYNFSHIKDGYLLDCTLGFGGHSAALLQKLQNIKILACDQDEEALNFCKQRFKNENRIKIFKSNFSQIFNFINEENIKGILADIGVSSFQLDENSRGFSLNSNELDMRMDKSAILNAKIIVNEYKKSELVRIFYDFGELKMAEKIADKILQARLKKQINTAKELCEILGDEKIFGRSVSIAKLVFQALRIEVNSELDNLKTLLENIEKKKPKNCRVCIICFHSLEDKIVKEKFKHWAKNCICEQNAIKCTCGNNNALGKILSKKPITPSKDEIKANSRASCAKMRIFEFN